jgi:poly-gamma-glutamate synthesis protein (capsule biosynthesis protein)
MDSAHLVAGDDAGFVTLLDLKGKQVWEFDLGSRVTALHSMGGQTILAGGWDERLTLLDRDGTEVWQAKLAGPVSRIVALPDMAFVATLTGHLHAVDLSGTERWHLDLGVTISELAIHGQGSEASLVLSLQDGSLISLDRAGTEEWRRVLGQGGPLLHVPDSEPGSQSTILAGYGGHQPSLGLLSGNGQILWHIALPSAPGALGMLDLDGDGQTEILAGLANGEVRAYDRDGRFRSSTNAGLSVWKLAPLDDESAVVLADVAAWKLEGRGGSTGTPWLSPPAMLSVLPDTLDRSVARAEGEAILAFLGDVSPSRTMESQIVRYGPRYPWTGLSPLLVDADLVAANLESALTIQGEPLNKSYLLRAHPYMGRTLLEAGFDLMTLANNHALDYGSQGLDETLATLQALGIATVGAGVSDKSAHRPAHFSVHGVRISVLAYAAARWTGSPDVPSTDRLAWTEAAAVEADIQSIREQSDLVVALLHAGTEYARQPSSDQVAFARAAIRAGADLVVGHHPHVTQTVERHEQGLIVYSLGDALFDIPQQAAMRGDLLRVHVTREGLVQAELWPFWIEDGIRPRLLDNGQGMPQYRIIYP